jgi:ferredoxin
MAIKIDKEKCIGCGTCIALAPKTFEFDSENKAKCINEQGDDEQTIKSATDACPVQAIGIT